MVTHTDTSVVTIDRFIVEHERLYPNATGRLSGILYDLALASKMIANKVRLAGLADILGAQGTDNVQGEAQQKLDVIANDIIIKALDHGGRLCAMASEEEPDIIRIPEKFRRGKYLLLFDPLDGSSNTDVNMPLGAIFSVLKHDGKGAMPAEAQLLRRGTEQVAAGYLLYGASTMLVFTVGRGVHGFTLEPSIGEYLLSHEQIRIPARGKVYAVNEGNYHKWPAGTQQYLDRLKMTDKAAGRPYSGRYSGCLVADVHRMLLSGGIYLYPGEKDKPEGKLRLLYEANPLALVVEQAGGKASTGTTRILDVQPTALHQRVPLLIGSPEDVNEAEACIQGRA